MATRPPPLARTPRELARALLKLSRANMTVISAVTYLAGATISTRTTPPVPFSTSRFLRGWLFILLTQFATHFLGEVYDLPTDRLNRHATPLTGGSRVLPTNAASASLALRAGYIALALAFLTLNFLVPRPARAVGLAMLVLAWAYSAPPAKLNHRALGELDASIVTSVLVPYFAAAVQLAVSGAFPWWSPALAFLVVPPFFVKIALFLVLNLADKRPDWAAGKLTLPVVFGVRATAYAHTACMLAAYISALMLALRNVFARGFAHPVWGEAWILVFILPSAPYGFNISAALLRNCPYRLDPLLAPSLFHSTLLVWGVMIHAMVRIVPVHGCMTFQTAFALVFAYITIRNVLKGRRRTSKKSDTAVAGTAMAGQIGGTGGKGDGSCTVLNVGEAAVGGKVGDEAEPLLDAEEGVKRMPSVVSARRDITIVGGGVGGLVAASALTQMGRSVLVLERRANAEEAEAGADLALWPGAIAILKDLGVSPEFFEKDCFPLECVHMCNMDFERMKSASSSEMRTAATILKTIDMAEVTEGTGENFVLVPRQRLMDALRAIVPADVVLYGANVVKVDEDEDNEEVTVRFSLKAGGVASIEFSEPQSSHAVTSRVVIGSDGARSLLRAHVSPGLGGADSVRFCGEVCYRGVLNLSSCNDVVASTTVEGAGQFQEELREKIAALLPDKPIDRTMRINYGSGLRSSFGYMSASGDIVYWWVKVQMDELPENRGKLMECTWPEPLKTLHDITPTSAFYMHPIEDSRSLPKWSTPRAVLVGDAAHVVTPNMGQGACLATEDAFVLATELVSNWRWPDGHLEAFYNYEQTRRPYAEAVAKESRKQLFLGQLRSRPAVFLRELLLQLVPTSVLQKALKANNFPVQAYLNIFRETLMGTGLQRAQSNP